jgi:putative component of membrane protein insertase Oxa1/YidC/SpoIIIJ protein YidD
MSATLQIQSGLRTIDRNLGAIMVVLVRGYQRHLSPRKGYSCAHRLRHGGDSCSEYGRNVFADEGWWTGIKKLRTRFRECARAHRSLRQSQMTARPHDEYFDEPSPSPPPEKKASPSDLLDKTAGVVVEFGCECCLMGLIGACTGG